MISDRNYLEWWPKESEQFKKLEKASIVGHTTTSTCQLWIRTGQDGEFILRLSTKKEPISFKAENRSDTITTLTLEGLSPNTFYNYSVHDKDNNHQILEGSFKTIPTDQDDNPFSFGFYSCHKPFDKKAECKEVTENGQKVKQKVVTGVYEENMEVWDYFLKTVKEEKLRFILGGGDQVYIDGIPGVLDMWQYLRDNMSEENGKLYPEIQEMVKMYREIYRYYWGFRSIQQIFATTPMYMTWDDHEILDGYGSYVFKGDDDNVDDELKFLLPKEGKNRQILTWDERFTLYKQMVSAGKQVYGEYQHSLNPKNKKAPDAYDYQFEQGTSAFYVLDGRGERDINLNPKSKPSDVNPKSKTTNDVLGDEQWDRFEQWLAEQKNSKSEFLFIVSSIPLVHIHPNVANATPTSTALKERKVEGLLDDDLRDSWAWNGHSQERNKLLEALFDIAKDKKVIILSGDVHVASAFQLSDKKGNTIYQLTSSGITYGQSPQAGLAMSAAIFTPEMKLRDELSKDYENYDVKPLGYWIARNYSVIKVFPRENRVEFAIHQKKRQEKGGGEITDTIKLHW